ASKPDAFDSREARDAELDRIRRRCRVLLVLLGGFLFLLLRDNRRLRKDMAADGAWLKAAQGLAVAAAPAVQAALPAPQGPPDQGGMPGMNRQMGGMGGGMGGMMGGMGRGMGGMGFGM
ncbi:unnamed protein product, partial [Polarella glacialis]